MSEDWDGPAAAMLGTVDDGGTATCTDVVGRR